MPVHAVTLGADVNEIEVAYILKKSPAYIVLSKNTSPEIAQSWKDAFNFIVDSGKLNEIANRWSDIFNISLKSSKKLGIYE